MKMLREMQTEMILAHLQHDYAKVAEYMAEIKRFIRNVR